MQKCPAKNYRLFHGAGECRVWVSLTRERISRDLPLDLRTARSSSPGRRRRPLPRALHQARSTHRSRDILWGGRLHHPPRPSAGVHSRPPGTAPRARDRGHGQNRLRGSPSADLTVMFYERRDAFDRGRVGQPALRRASSGCSRSVLSNTALGPLPRATILYTELHDRATLVDAVDYASVIGTPPLRALAGRRLGLPSAVPACSGLRAVPARLRRSFVRTAR